MKRITFTAFLLLATFSSGAGELPGSIKQFIDNKAAGACYEIDNEYLLCGKVLQLFYVNRIYAPAWFRKDVYQNDEIVLEALNQKPEAVRVKAKPL